jgi:hypothetical protein
MSILQVHRRACANACKSTCFSAVRSMEIQVCIAFRTNVVLFAHVFTCRLKAAAMASAAGFIGLGTAKSAQV